MKIAIAAATSFEIEPVVAFLWNRKMSLKHEFEIIVTGIGMVAATYQLTSFIQNRSPGLMIQAGIAGLFDTNTKLGGTMLVSDEVIADLGVEENNLFNDLFDMGFMLPDARPFTGKRLANPGIPELKKLGLPVVSGATVNEITTHTNRVTLIREKYNPAIETMEGAAFHYVCLQQNIPFLQLRAASNYVGERDKSKWEMKDAVKNLNESLIKIIQQIS